MLNMSSNAGIGGWRRFALFACVLGLAAMVFIAWMNLQLGGDQVTTAVDDIGEAAAAAVAAISCGVAAFKTQARLRLGWALLGASAASWCLGEVVWSVYEVGMGIAVPTPSAADIGFLAAIPLSIAGIMSFAQTARGTSTGLRLWLDRVIVALSLFFLGWELGLNNLFSGSTWTSWPNLVGLSYPVGDILVGTVLLLAIRRATDETHGRLLLLLGGLAANALADSTFAYLNLEGTYAFIVDAGWVVGYLMIALAALWPSGIHDRTSEEKPIDIWQIVVPWLPILAGGMVVIIQAARGQPLDVLATVVAGVVIGLLMVSQVIAHIESLTLLIGSRLSAATLNEVIVNAPLGVVRVTTAMTIIQANPSFRSIVRSTGDLAGTSLNQFFPPDEVSLLADRLDKLSDVVESTELEAQGTRLDGTTVWLHLTASGVRKRSGEIDYFLVMFEDVSERRSTEDALKTAYAELEGLVAERTSELRSANERLATEAISDPLTGLYNRRYLAEFVERELSRTRRSGNKMVFVLIDVDHFKQVNDTFGHDAGDHVLKEVSAFLRMQIRHEDLAFRYGGEEFLLVQPSSTVDAVAGRIEQIRERVSLLKIEHGGVPIGSVTFSIGVAVFPDDGDTAEAVISRADAALYEAKQAGRNRIVHHLAVV